LFSTLIEIACNSEKKWYADIDGPAATPWQSGLGCRKGLEFLAGLEADSFAGRDAYLLTCTRVAAYASLARLDGKDAKAAELDTFAAAESVFHGLEDGFNGLLGFGAGDAGLLYDSIDDIELNHTSLQRNRKPMLDRGLQVVKRRAV
jgi:hypothetical protein